jgi:hypothetical protein
MRRSIAAVGIVLLAISAFPLYIGLRAYFFPATFGQVQAGAGIAMLGFLTALIGMVLVIWGIVSKKEKPSIKK